MSEVVTNQGQRSALLKAISQVSLEVGKVAKGDFNQHGKYRFASIDAFLEAVGPAMAAAGLVATVNQVSTEVCDRTNQYDKTSTWERSVWQCQLEHFDGGVYGPVERTIEVPLVGAQTNGIGQSYAQKAFYRMVFNIPTGDVDADSIAPNNTERSKPVQSKADADADFRRWQEVVQKTNNVDELRAWGTTNRPEQGDRYRSNFDQLVIERIAAIKEEQALNNEMEPA